jgi:hypothetical protein
LEYFYSVLELYPTLSVVRHRRQNRKRGKGEDGRQTFIFKFRLISVLPSDVFELSSRFFLEVIEPAKKPGGSKTPLLEVLRITMWDEKKRKTIVMGKDYPVS